MPEFDVGQTILGEYIVAKELGHGAMGKVWLVKSISNRRRFAVKQARYMGDKSRKAFLAELQTWIDLPEHPNILPCRFFRTVGDKIVIFTDYMEGGSLADWIAERKLTTLEQILDVAIQFAWGLHAIHERGLVHQDVKPGNVLMTADGVPKVADFGLARARLRTGGDAEMPMPVPLEEKGFWAGVKKAMGGSTPPIPRHVEGASLLVSMGGMTPAYASPEQKAGQPLSRKTDIWSWGVSVLDMFVGGVSCPHGGHIAAEMLTSFVEQGQQGDGLPEMPEALAIILRKCFARTADERWQTMGEVSEKLRNVYQDLVGQEYQRALAPVSEHKGAAHQRGIGKRRSKDGAEWGDPRGWLEYMLVAEGKDNDSAAKEAQVFMEQQVRSRRGKLTVDVAAFDYARMICERLIAAGQRELEVEQAGLCVDASFAHATIDDAAGALELRCKAVNILERLVSTDGREDLVNKLAIAYEVKGNALAVLGDHNEAMGCHDKCIAILNRLKEMVGHVGAHEELAKAYMNKGAMLFTAGDAAGADRMHDKCISVLLSLADESRTEDADPVLAKAYMNKANARNSLGDLEGAVRFNEESIAIWRHLLSDGRGDYSNDFASSCLNKAAALVALGDIPNALVTYDICIAVRLRLVEQEGRMEFSNDLATALMNKASAILSVNRFAEATELLDKSLAIWRRLIEKEGRHDLTGVFGTACTNMAIALFQQQNIQAGMDAFEEAEDALRGAVDKGRTELRNQLANVLLNKANAHQLGGDLGGAIELVEECVDIQRQLRQEGQSGAVGELAKAEVVRAMLITACGPLENSERMRARQAYDSLVKEARRSGRQELVSLAKVAANVLSKYL